MLDLNISFEPGHALRILRAKNKSNAGINRCDYTQAWNEILNYSIEEERISIQGFSGRDDTLRRGQGRQVVENAASEKFREYLAESIAKNLSNGCEGTFINTWNEWGKICT